MKQEVKAALDTVAGRRTAQLQKLDPAAKASYVLDDEVPRAVVKVEKEGHVINFEFLETAATAGMPSNIEDYVFAANEFGTVTVHLPEANYQRDIAITVLNDIQQRIRTSGAKGDFHFSGFIYDIMGNFKKVR